MRMKEFSKHNTLEILALRFDTLALKTENHLVPHREVVQMCVARCPTKNLDLKISFT
jgi:hypothetical protein